MADLSHKSSIIVAKRLSIFAKVESGEITKIK